MSAEEVGNGFIQHFYQTLGTNPSNLASLYQPTSTLTFEGVQFVGTEAIISKYVVRDTILVFFITPLLYILVVFQFKRYLIRCNVLLLC